MAQSISVYTPLAYVFVVVTALIIFSSVHRRRKIASLYSTEPIFNTNFARDNYFALKDLPKSPPEKILKAALLRWASEDVRKLLKLKTSKEILSTLHQRGSVGDNTWTKFLTQEKQVEVELNTIAQEANELKPEWANTLFQTAQEIALNQGLRKRLVETQKLKEDYQEQFDKVQKRTLEELTK
ncbi:hypothetical protein DV451_003972 [Geotrichum candidum]|uniref:Similar to Saccharomyces cerevisiae YBR171W SEC66 Non-essential subunit of Sec63 complex (Sec63p, Sec62p,Sec66p and Sec72p) n=1 Tax=Geotrichum candidum TaxID=1173061 RepID=A0A0J9X7I5_GEOCN|nr:hypothetical protein DV451_003972 [Geotrichum candidum]KAI9213100.1 hypothetical protein DS838_002040 [Geotrichum bryndzae]KAF5105317.1 hypothetical protein DV453_004946 [Geotrichum candidum]KAF5117587.1 hypothetical protein DV454_001071 [Geotrichum candidum]KAF5118546.1 hypothetical protein DV452_002007 [Geotrichum candidum]